MNLRLVVNVVGRVLCLGAALMCVPLVVAVLGRSDDISALLISIAAQALLGLLLTRVKVGDFRMRPNEGFVIVAMVWLAFSAFGALPFMLSGYVPRFEDALFESVSGFTTTGSSILVDVEALPRGLLFWRSFTHWIGGMGVLVLSLAVLPKMGGRAVHILRAESPGPEPGKLLPRIGATARILYMIYLGLTLLEVIILKLLGMSLYDSLIHTFGSAGTGGFSNYNLSVGHFGSVPIEATITIFMLLFGVNFTVYFGLLINRRLDALKNEELRAYGVIVLSAMVLIALNLISKGIGVSDAARHASFQVASIITTTGYSSTNFDLWPQFSRAVLVALMIIGACAGSTGGGIKVQRVLLLGKSVLREVRHTFHPRSVNLVRSDARKVEESVMGQVAAFFFAYIAIVLIAMLVVSFDDFSFETNLTAVLSAISNIGPGLGVVGPMGNFAGFSMVSKLTLTLCMLIGRLEIFPLLVLLANLRPRRGWLEG